MNQAAINAIIAEIETIPDKKSYWFVRTNGGDYYQYFLQGNYIALGYNEITLYDISTVRLKDGNIDEDALIGKIVKAYSKETRPKYISTQLLDFTFNIKKGDIVIIPSTNSDMLSFAEVMSTPAYLNEVEDPCPYIKRKKVKYIKKNVSFQSIDSYLLWLKYTQRTITHIDQETAAYIDRIISTIYIKNNSAHLALNIESIKPIKAFDLFKTWAEIIELAEDFGKQEGIDVKKEEFDAKINLQSPGTLELINESIVGIVLVCLVLGGLFVGADIESDNKIVPFKLKTGGFLEKMTKYLNAKTDRKLKETLIKKLEDLDLKKEDVQNIIKQIGGNDTKQIEDSK